MDDEFATDKGIKEDYDGVVKDAHFQAMERGGTSLVLKVLADDGEEVEAFYRIGPDWASFDGGETVEHPSRTRIRADSQLAKLVDHAMQAGAEGVIRERSKGKGQRTAGLWPGLRFHWDVAAEPYDFPDKETGEQVKGVSYKSYPSKYLGEGEIPSESTPSSTGTPQVPAEILARLKAAAVAKPFNDWVDEALTIDYVRENMLSALSDESFYQSLK